MIWELRDGKGGMFWKGRARVSDAQDVKGKRGLLMGQLESVHEGLQVDMLEKRLDCGHLRIRCGKQKCYMRSQIKAIDLSTQNISF